MKILLFGLLFLSFLLSPAHAQDSRLQVVATTTIIADIARNVGGDFVDVVALIPENTDVHAFELRPSDIVLVENADLFLIVGLGLEGFLGDLLNNSATPAVEVSIGVPVLAFEDHHDEEDHADDETHTDAIIGIYGEAGICAEEDHEEVATEEAEHEEHGVCDPHIWGNPNNASIIAQNIASAFAQADPAHADAYLANAQTYQELLTVLDIELQTLLSTIAPENRIIVTNHEFLAYFAHQYDLEVLATVIPGGTSLAEPNPRELAQLGALIRETGVRAIFAEVSDNQGLAQVLANETGSNIAIITLYSDSLSTGDEDAPTYLDYLRYNATIILEALTQP